MAPGVTTVVATEGDLVLGFAEVLSDGELQAYLANVAVDRTRRAEGIGRQLVTETLRLAGGERIDLLSEDGATDFYRRFPNFEKPGFRLYPFYKREGEGEG
jgi:predicted N-acetyltransferase YhbS